MLTGIHFLLTYACNFECDHCFVYSKPQALGTFTVNQIRRVFEELINIGTIQRVYFEGGEAFLYYPLMIEGVKIARDNGFEVGIVTNAYWATTEEDAELWLQPLLKLGISDISLSDDMYHYEDERNSLAKRALAAAKSLGMPVSVISVEAPRVEKDQETTKLAPVIGGSTMFRGRAVDKLIKGLPTRPWIDFTECPYENLRNPKRVHLDSYGNVHLCQGLSIGNMWQTPLSDLINNHHCDLHPICRPLVIGGPAYLAKEYEIKHSDEYVDACHLCYDIRLRLIDKFPEYLAPRQVYGL